MFPEITRDEVFRIEAPHVWLRWPVASDAVALANVMAQNCAADGATMAQVNPDAVRSLITAWRDDMEAGRALHFAVQLKTGGRQTIGIIHTGTDRSCVDPCHRPFGDEAAVALRRMMTLLGVPPPRRTPPMAQQRVFPAPAVLAACCLQA